MVLRGTLSSVRAGRPPQETATAHRVPIQPAERRAPALGIAPKQKTLPKFIGSVFCPRFRAPAARAALYVYGEHVQSQKVLILDVLCEAVDHPDADVADPVVAPVHELHALHGIEGEAIVP